MWHSGKAAAVFQGRPVAEAPEAKRLMSQKVWPLSGFFQLHFNTKALKYFAGTRNSLPNKGQYVGSKANPSESCTLITTGTPVFGRSKIKIPILKPVAVFNYRTRILSLSTYVIVSRRPARYLLPLVEHHFPEGFPIFSINPDQI